MKFDSETYLTCSLGNLLESEDIEFVSKKLAPIKNICGEKIEGLKFGDIKTEKNSKSGSITFCPKSNGNIQIDEAKIYYDGVESWNYDPAYEIKAHLASKSCCGRLDINLKIGNHLGWNYLFSIKVGNNAFNKNPGIYYINFHKEFSKKHDDFDHNGYNDVAEISYFDGEVLKSIATNFQGDKFEKFVSTTPDNLEKVGFIADKTKRIVLEKSIDEVVSSMFKEGTKENFDSWAETVFEKEKVNLKSF